MQQVQEEEKHNGRFIYLSDNNDIYIKQKMERELLGDDRKVLSDADAVVILVQYIKHPDISIEGLAKMVALEGRIFEPMVIGDFLGQYDLLKKAEDTQP